MRTSQLLRALRHHRETGGVFLGVFPSDRLPRSIPKHRTVALIVNTDPSHRPGHHWCAFYITPTCVYFFDFYGCTPRLKSFQRLMRCRRKKKVFARRLQGRGTVCGHYCMYFILAMVRGDINNRLALFGDDLNANDRVVRNVVMNNFMMVT